MGEAIDPIPPQPAGRQQRVDFPLSTGLYFFQEDSQINLRSINWLLYLCFLSILPPAAFTQDSTGREPDIAYHQTIELEIKGKKGESFDLSSNVTIELQYLSERSTARNEFYITKAYWVEVDKVKAVCRGRKLKETNIEELYPHWEDVFNSDLKLFKITFPRNLRPGDTVMYSYRKKYRDIALLPIVSIPNVNRLEKLTLVVKHPKGVTVDLESFFPREEISLIKEQISEEETQISVGPIDYFEELQYYAFNETHGCFCLKMKWDDEVITPVTNEDFVSWYGKLTQLEPTVADSIVRALPLDFSRSNTVTDSLAVINDFVRHNVRYISDTEYPHSIVPHSALYVLARMYGDCKDRANLVSALARAYGITVSMALTTAVPYVTLEAVHPALFNHVICCYEGGGTPLFFDPTAKYLPFGTLHEDLIGQKALILNPHGPCFVNLEAEMNQPVLDLQLAGHIDSLRNCRARITLRGDAMSEALWANSEKSGFELQLALSSIAALPLYRMSLDSLQIDSITYDRIFLTGRADISNFVIGSGSKKYIPQAPFAAYGSTFLERESDPLPLHVDKRSIVTLSMELEAPGLEAVSDSVQLEAGENAYFKADIRNLDSGKIRLDYTLRRLDKQILSESKEAVMNFARQYLNMRRNLFILREREP